MTISGRAFTSSSLEMPGLARVPPPPRTPSPRARQMVFRYQGGPFISLVVGGAFALLGGLFVCVFCWRLPGDFAIDVSGRAVAGRVISAQLDRSTSVNERHPTVVRFTYNVDDRPYEANSSSVDDGLLALKANDQVQLEVSTLRPSWARVAGTTRAWAGYFGLFTLLFPLIGVPLFTFTVRAHRRAVRAFVHGQPVSARVVSAGFDTSYEMNGRHPFKVAWEFRAADGQVYTGSLSSMKVLELEPLAQAGHLIVLHDPADPRANTVYIE